MSVWPDTLPPQAAPLAGSEGMLVSVSIDVDARYLESLLEALAQVSFPVNPEIYHEAAIIYRYADGQERAVDTTLVEFPAYASRLDEVRRALESYGFDPASLHVTGMMEEIHAEVPAEAGPTGAPYVASYRVKRRAVGKPA